MMEFSSTASTFGKRNGIAPVKLWSCRIRHIPNKYTTTEFTRQMQVSVLQHLSCRQEFGGFT